MLRFSCEKALLQAAVSTASRAVAAKSSIPALEGILLEAGQELRLTGYDRAISIEHEDGLMSIKEGMEKAVSLLKPILIDGSDTKMWWI